MIKLTQLNGEPIYISYSAIQLIEEAPHTIITTLSNKQIIVKESAAEITRLGMESIFRVNRLKGE